MPEVTELLQEIEVAGEDDPTAVENEKDKVAAAQAPTCAWRHSGCTSSGACKATLQRIELLS